MERISCSAARAQIECDVSRPTPRCLGGTVTRRQLPALQRDDARRTWTEILATADPSRLQPSHAELERRVYLSTVRPVPLTPSGRSRCGRVCQVELLLLRQLVSQPPAGAGHTTVAAMTHPQSYRGHFSTPPFPELKSDAPQCCKQPPHPSPGQKTIELIRSR